MCKDGFKIDVMGVRKYIAGYEIRTEIWYRGDDEKGVEMKAAYTPVGDYIGSSKDAYFLCKTKGIKPEKADPKDDVCSIGFCEKEQKYFGWSHRAIYGFGIGDSVKMGDSGYQPENKEDFVEDCIRFWDDAAYHTDFHGKEVKEKGVLGVMFSYTYNDKVPNKELRGTISEIFEPYPYKWGRGEWTAKTLEDAKEMAMDFAESVG